MRFLPIPGRDVGLAIRFAPADAGQGRPWPGYEAEATRLDARITDLALSGNHPSLQVRAQDGMNWTVELGDRHQTKSAGLTDRQAAPGDHAVILGHCASGFGERRIRAISVTIGGRDYHLAPEVYQDA